MIRKKLKSRDELSRLCEDWRNQGLKIGFTSGAFDLLHAGHVEYLETAKDYCDILIVGLNSDASVARYKGSDRPILPQQERAILIASLESVDYVFIFEERRNFANIQELKPDFYIKAGDYTVDKLTSREALQEYGGEAFLIPVNTKTSTSQIIEKIRASLPDQSSVVEYDQAVYFPTRQTKSRPAIFLDRDGTINEDIDYLHEPKKFKLLPNVIDGLKKLQAMEFRLVIVTTQAGIGLGYFTKEDFYKVNRKMFSLFSDAGIRIDKIYFCPHNVTEDCPCRKPKPGLLLQAQQDLNLDMSHSIMIGDKTSDIQTGKNVGIRTVLVKTGKAGLDGEFPVTADYEAADLLDAANWILESERQIEQD